MNKPSDHLVRTNVLEAAKLALSELTGLARLSIEMHRLAPDEAVSIAADTERFIYVLEGTGSLSAEQESDESVVALDTGDFVALAAGESGKLNTDQGITVLLGQA